MYYEYIVHARMKNCVLSSTQHSPPTFFKGKAVRVKKMSGYSDGVGDKRIECALNLGWCRWLILLKEIIMADKQVTKDELVDGMKYHVIMDDCCIKGEFTSVLRQVIYVDRDVDYLEAAYFENGLMLTSMDNCTIYEIE